MEYKAVRTEVVMRLLSFKTGLLLALIPAVFVYRRPVSPNLRAGT